MVISAASRLVRDLLMLAIVLLRELAGIYNPSFYFLAKPIRKRTTVLTMTARYSWKISAVLSRVSAIRSTATQMKRMVKKIDRYFILELLYHNLPLFTISINRVNDAGGLGVSSLLYLLNWGIIAQLSFPNSREDSRI